MSAAVQLVRPSNAPPPRSPEREALAAAITRHAEAEQRLAATKRAMESSASAILQARTNLKKAAGAVEQAKTDAASYLTAQMLGSAGDAPLTIKQARAALQDAEHELADVQASRAALERAHADAEGSLAVASVSLEGAQREVVRTDPATQRLIADFDTAHRCYVDLKRALEFVDRVYGLSARFGEPALSELPGATPWKLATEALRRDADAPLPQE
jgi:chromosome segregation ATPase